MDTWIININNHQGNVNQNHNEILPHTCQMASIEKNTNIKCWQGHEEKGTLAHCYGNVNWYNHYGKQYRGS